MTEIKNAIILAAGRGSRMGYLTNDMPKCMMTVNNKTIIQKTIETLKYKNIKNIIVVTGYKADILEKHIRTFDNDIIFINNAEWLTTNSMYSMYLALKYLSNSIVIDSDIYINNINSILTKITYSGYSAIKTINDNEWNLDINAKHFISSVHISDKYNALTCLPIIDISYWTEKDALKISNYFNFIFKHFKHEFKNKYWDEVPLFYLFTKLKLKRYDLNFDDVCEFDTEEELNNLRRRLCSVD